MKLKVKYLLFMLVFLLMPVSNVKGYEGSYIENQNPSNVEDYAKANSDIYFNRDNINFKKCKTDISSAIENVEKNIVVKENVYGGNVVIVKNDLISNNEFFNEDKENEENKDDLIFTTIRNDLSSTLEIKMTCPKGAKDIKTNEEYDVEIKFSHLKITKPKVINVGGKDLIILADTSSPGAVAGDEFPLGLGIVSKLANYSGGKYIAHDTYDKCGDKDNCGIGVAIRTTITLKSSSPKRVALLFQDLDRPDVATTRVLNGEIGSYEFANGAEFAESVVLRNGFNNFAYYSIRAKFNIFSEDSESENAGCPDNKIPCVVKPISDNDNNDFLIFADASNANKIVFNWCGSNAHTAIGFLYFPTEEKPPEDDLPPGSSIIEHICSNDDRTLRGNSCSNKSLADDPQRDDSGATVTVTHSSCRQDNVIHVYLRDVYTISDVKRYPQNADGSMGSGTNCVKVDLQFPIVLLEEINFSISDLYNDDGVNKIYAGGGFNWDGVILNNYISYVYRYYKNDSYYVGDYSPEGNFLYRINHEYFLKNSDGTYPSKPGWDPAYFHDNIEFFTDSSCKVPYKTSLDTYVANEIYNFHDKINVSDTYKNNLLANSSGKSMARFKSVNPNNASIRNEALRVDDAFFPGGNYYHENISLLESWIDPRTAKISFDELNNYINGGYKWYVPLKYPEDTVYVSANNLQISRIRNLKINVRCSINVKNILYESDGSGGLKLAYKYRPVTLSNDAKDVFPGKIREDIPQNWRDWYCGDSSNVNCGSIPSIQSNRNRLANTYDRSLLKGPLYSITLNSNNISAIRDISNVPGRSYASFSYMHSSGASRFVNNDFSQYFILNPGHYCKLGYFDPDPDGCNKEW